MSEAEIPGAVPSAIPVSVLMERRLVTRGPWSLWQWEALAVVAGEQVSADAAACTLVEREEGREQYLWSGLGLGLYKDACEGYWYNLVSERPHVFIVSFEDAEEDGEGFIRPHLVTASQDEANGYMETDAAVHSVPMPEQVHQWVERFVVENYEPEVKRKRRREKWAREDGDGRGRPRARDGQG